eukprot:scaffold10917_cov68-Cyclotella_meneghiniana.AAC.5
MGHGTEDVPALSITVPTWEVAGLDCLMCLISLLNGEGRVQLLFCTYSEFSECVIVIFHTSSNAKHT